jgi:DNA-directed RNA polymerase subunit RPC12/RpoP
VPKINCTEAFTGVTLGSIINQSNLVNYSYEAINTALSNYTYLSNFFQFNDITKAYHHSFSAIHIPETTTLSIRTNFSIPAEDARTIEVTNNFAIDHFVNIVFSLVYYQNEDKVTILVDTAKSSYNPNLSSIEPASITPELASSAKYSLRNEKDKSEVAKGNLNYDAVSQKWITDVNMKDIKAGSYYAVLSFEVEGIQGVVTTPNEKSDKNSVEKKIVGNNYMLYVYIVIGASVAILAGIGLYLKRAQKNIERKPEKKAGPIEIVEISKSELKKTRLATPPKKKATAMNKTGLIFNVPTWEVEDDEVTDTSESFSSPVASAASTSSAASSSSPVFSTSPIAAAPPVSYTLHCPGCNSWFEIDFFEKMQCPKCSTDLDVAMWCKLCNKWFDVAEPAEVNCPLCSSKLGYSK